MTNESNKTALDAYNKILRFNLDRSLEAAKRVPPANCLYHYTTAEGLKGIIEKSELWATSAYFLNDSAEIAYGCEIVCEALESWPSQQKDRESFGCVLADNLLVGFRKDLFDFGSGQEIFLACFCEGDNLLSQWRAYGQSGGYSIGFEVPDFTMGAPPLIMPEPVAYTHRWVKVVYDKAEQLALCREVLDATLGPLTDSETSRAVTAQALAANLGPTPFLTTITDMLLEEAVAFKHDAFKVEQEWRIVVRSRRLLKQAGDDGGKTAVPFYFRSVKGMVVPYVKILPTKGHYTKLPIASVRTGPTIDKETAAFGVRLLLETNNYKKLPIIGSEITIRL